MLGQILDTKWTFEIMLRGWMLDTKWTFEVMLRCLSTNELDLGLDTGESTVCLDVGG